MSAQAFFRDLRAAMAHTLRTQGEATAPEVLLLAAYQRISHADWLRGGDPLAATAVDLEQRDAIPH